MVSSKTGLKSIVILALGFCLMWAAPAVAEEEVPLADGSRWTESTPPEKTAYMLGLSNYMTMEYVSQVKDGDPPPTRDQSPTPDFWEGSEGVTLDAAIAAVDKFYAENPDKMTTPVVVVLWTEVVEPNLKK